MDNQVFTVGDARYVYAFDSLPFSHIMMVEEIYHFKRQQIERKSPRFEDVVASGGADYKCRAASYLLLPCDANGEAQRPDVKAARKFVDGLTGEDVSRIEECIADFFQRRGMSDLESDVHSRTFLSLEMLTSIGSRVLSQNGSGNGNDASTSLQNAKDSSDQANSIDG